MNTYSSVPSSSVNSSSNEDEEHACRNVLSDEKIYNSYSNSNKKLKAKKKNKSTLKIKIKPILSSTDSSNVSKTNSLNHSRNESNENGDEYDNPIITVDSLSAYERELILKEFCEIVEEKQ
jgi:L-rhamnose isomerase